MNALSEVVVATTTLYKYFDLIHTNVKRKNRYFLCLLDEGDFAFVERGNNFAIENLTKLAI